MSAAGSAKASREGEVSVAAGGASVSPLVGTLDRADVVGSASATSRANSPNLVLVCGSRFTDLDWEDWLTLGPAIKARIDALPQSTTILTGGARGVDSWAHDYAGNRGLARKVMRADWKTHGKRAGIIRNVAMLDERPDLVIAFWDGASRGTAHTLDEARERGIPVEVHAPGTGAQKAAESAGSGVGSDGGL